MTRNVSFTLALTIALLTVTTAAAQTPASQTPTPQTPTPQTPAPQPAPPPGGLSIEKVQSGLLVAPEYRVADLGGRVGSLLGGYAGHLTDNTWLIGGGGYWLTNRDDDFKLAYLGFVVEWLARTDRKIGFGARTLLGGGSATLPRTFSDLRGVHDARFGSRRTPSGDIRVAVNDDFFIAEPQGNVLVNLTPKYRLSIGVAYRAVGAASLLGDDLNGVSGSVTFQVGGGH